MYETPDKEKDMYKIPLLKQSRLRKRHVRGSIIEVTHKLR
ncbi:hypothetical protein SLEP1_g47871 [Rubroshorea leprosula]|uniref:Uncharacterized protein n=1 Tax=Rubroshorea leprosula TaxID=152421 RepID=A0AAV5LTY0_9ROSI|nr:hypothetical protein SLEP1_g47871 [Rubroshorea leprosula]